MVEDIDFLRSLLHHEKIFLKFSYYSGFLIASFNFIIFIIASILFAKVNIKIYRRYSLGAVVIDNWMCVLK